MKVKMQTQEASSAGELVTFIHKGQHYDSPLPANVKKGEEVELEVEDQDGRDIMEQVTESARACNYYSISRIFPND